MMISALFHCSLDPTVDLLCYHTVSYHYRTIVGGCCASST